MSAGDRTAPARFEVLDGLRGLAALAVMLTHYGRFTGQPLFRGAVVAVDLFFILSGFVIAFSYEQKILAGMSARAFAQARLVRLGPLYYAGLVLGMVAALLLAVPGQALWPMALPAVVGLPCFNEVTRQVDEASVQGAIFPLDDPAWSLFFELFVNAVFFAWLWRCRGRGLIGLVVPAMMVFLACALYLQDTGPGWGTGNFVYGFPRVLSGFFLGVLICRHRARLAVLPPALALVLVAGFFALTLVGDIRACLFNTFVLAPLVVLAGAGLSAGRLRAFCHFSGELSYPLYVLHYPLYELLYAGGVISGLPPLARLLVASFSAVLLASIAARLDGRVRAWLKRALA